MSWKIDNQNSKVKILIGIHVVLDHISQALYLSFPLHSSHSNININILTESIQRYRIFE